MRILQIILSCVLFATAVSPVAAHAENKTYSYGFAVGRHGSTMKETSSIGSLFDMLNPVLDTFRGEKGIMLFMSAVALAVFAHIAGLRHTAMSAAIVAVGILLLNKPLLLFPLMVPLAVLKHRMWKSRKTDSENLPVVGMGRELMMSKEDALSGMQKRTARKRRNTGISVASVTGSSPEDMGKLLRPL